MINPFTFLFVVLFMFSFWGSASFGKTTIKVASLDWCPQLCMDPKKPGYVHEIAQHIFTKAGYKLHIKVYPWSRAIAVTREGDFHALLGPAKNEAPDLVYPAQEVGVQKMCFFKRSSDPWVYNSAQSLKGKRVILIQDGAWDELTDYMKKNKNQFSQRPGTSRYIENSAKTLLKGHSDLFIFDHNTTSHKLGDLEKRGKLKAGLIKQAGCIEQTPIYVAFTPTKKALSAELARVFDQGMVAFKKSEDFPRIMKKYGLEVWS